MQLPFTKEQFFDLLAAYNVGLWPALLNQAAWGFAALFLLQAAVFFWAGVVHGRLSFAPWRNAWAPVAWGLVAYSLVYPAINAAEHLSVSRIPTFGVPCPTMIFTAGMLMLATPRSWRLSIVPVIWSLIGGSAAFLLGVHADYALPLAGIALTIFSTRRTSGNWGSRNASSRSRPVTQTYQSNRGAA